MRRIKWRTALWIFIILAVVLCFAAYTKPGMMLTVRLLEDHLTSNAEAWIAEGGDEDYLPSKDIGGYRIEVCPSAECVFFVHYTFKETGFFYSASGELVGYMGQDVVYEYSERGEIIGSHQGLLFEEHGNGWLWEDGVGSDNWFYAEHIIGNWYWYEMHY